MSNQARNQLGAPRVAKSFLRRDEIFQTMSNSFQLCPTDFSRAAKRFVGEASPPSTLVTGLCPIVLMYVQHIFQEAEKFSS